MPRVVIAGLLGAVVYYAWGMLAWMVLPLHNSSIRPLPDQAAVVEALTDQNLSRGAYILPFSEDMEEWENPDSEFQTAHRSGPIATILYDPEGAEIMPPSVLIGGFLIDVAAAFLVAWLLSLTLPGRPNFGRRVAFVSGLGILVALVSHGALWNWMHFPPDWTIAFAVDNIVGWALTGMVMAYVLQPTAEAIGTPPAPASPAAVASPVASPAASSVAKSTPEAKTQPGRSEALTLLAALQREARFLDIVKEPLDDYSDAQIGAAARDVLRDCGAVLDRMFDLQAVVSEKEGEVVQVPADHDAQRFKISGTAPSDAAFDATLVHHGWVAQRCKLPQWSGDPAAARIVAPAEVEAK